MAEPFRFVNHDNLPRRQEKRQYVSRPERVRTHGWTHDWSSWDDHQSRRKPWSIIKSNQSAATCWPDLRGFSYLSFTSIDGGTYPLVEFCCLLRTGWKEAKTSGKYRRTFLDFGCESNHHRMSFFVSVYWLVTQQYSTQHDSPDSFVCLKNYVKPSKLAVYVCLVKHMTLCNTQKTCI